MSAQTRGGAALKPDQAATKPPLRFISAASLFDGHDAAINMIRRLLQAHGAEVVHLGHNRSVADIVRAAIQEDADGVAVSSYQGGHNEYFQYMVDMLRERGRPDIRVIVGGGGTIAPHEIEALERHGVEKIYTPEDGRKMGLNGMIDDVFARIAGVQKPPYEFGPLHARDHGHIARTLSVLEGAMAVGNTDPQADQVRRALAKSKNKVPVIGITGTGGAGKSSLTDELLARLVRYFPDKQIAVVAMDPTRRRSGGALLGDRIRMNSLSSDSIFMRSLATRRQNMATAAVLKDVIDLYKAAGFDLIIVETAGIGQSDTEIVDMVDLSLYVMTSEYGAASQLEKIDMLDFADLIVLNKAEKRGAADSLRDVRKQWRRNHPDQAKVADADIPVYPTIASRFNDPGVNRLFEVMCRALSTQQINSTSWQVADVGPTELVAREPLIPGQRVRYLAEIAQHGRGVREELKGQEEAARRAYGIYEALKTLRDAQLPDPLDRFPEAALSDESTDGSRRELRRLYNQALDEVGTLGVGELKAWPARAAAATAQKYSYKVRDKDVVGDNYTESLARQPIPKLAVPSFKDWGEILHFLGTENLPGSYPYTGVSVPARRRRPDPHVCGRGWAGENQQTLPLSGGRQRPGETVDGIRLDDSVW
jgi:isobutyryl-CoA mutase